MENVVLLVSLSGRWAYYMNFINLYKILEGTSLFDFGYDLGNSFALICLYLLVGPIF